MATIATRNGVTRALVILLGAAVFLNYVDRGAIAVAAPLMKGELDLSATEFGTAVSAFFWIYAPVQLVVGWLCDRFSVYRLMAWGVILWAASTLLMGIVGGFLSLLVLRVLLGVGESIVFPGSGKIIARHVPPEGRGLANAWCAAGIALGPAVGTLVGGMI
ncbi:MAG: MFS transporter, partial [Sphingomicrobium sp.]